MAYGRDVYVDAEEVLIVLVPATKSWVKKKAPKSVNRGPLCEPYQSCLEKKLYITLCVQKRTTALIIHGD